MIRSLLLLFVLFLSAGLVAGDQHSVLLSTGTEQRGLEQPGFDEDWPAVGTKVFYEFDDGWYEGTITARDENGVTITWTDETIDEDDFTVEEVNQMAQDYQTMIVEGGGTTDPAAAPTADDDDDDTWPVGTRVYYEFDDGWDQGTITDWNDIGYELTWDSGRPVDAPGEYDDDTIDQMVYDYETMIGGNEGMAPAGAPSAGGDDFDEDDDTWPIGTKVYYEFDDGWYEGEITDWDDDGYTIEWVDGTQDVDDFTDEEVDQMVEDYEDMVANGGGGTEGDATDPTPAPTEDDSWPIGTRVYYEFDDGWEQGEITGMDDIGYELTWDSDGSVDAPGEFSDEEVDQMVQDYQVMIVDGNGGEGGGGAGAAEDEDDEEDDDDTWPIGTRVYYEFDDGWYEGTITDWDDDGYTITWDSDGSQDVDDFTDEEVDQMVEDYQNMVANGGSGTETSASGNGGISDGMKPGAIFIVVAVVLVALFGVGCFIRRRRTGKEEMQGLRTNSNRNGTTVWS